MGMIKSEKELTGSRKKVAEMELYKSQAADEIRSAAALYGLDSFKAQIEEEIQEYENIKNGHIPEYFFEFENIGLLLIALRIKKGWTQARLAQELGVAPSQVSRDENNDYHGVSLPIMKKILKALDFDLIICVK